MAEEKNRRSFIQKMVLAGMAVLVPLVSTSAEEKPHQKPDKTPKDPDVQEKETLKKSVEKERAIQKIHADQFALGVFALYDESQIAMKGGMSAEHKLAIYNSRTPSQRATLRQISSEERSDKDRSVLINLFQTKMSVEQVQFYKRLSEPESKDYNTILTTPSILTDEQKILYAEAMCLYERTRDPSKLRYGKEDKAHQEAFVAKVQELDKLDSATKTAIFGRMMYHASKNIGEHGIRLAGDTIGFAPYAKNIRYIAGPANNSQTTRSSVLPDIIGIMRAGMNVNSQRYSINKWGEADLHTLTNRIQKTTVAAIHGAIR